ncbi:hypothetical protein [Mycolicibacterium thermoresistibile]
MTDENAPWDDSSGDEELHDDDHDDLAALDFSYVEEPETVVDEAASVASPDSDVAEDGATDSPLFTVTSPDEKVTVTTFLNGAVYRIELGASATHVTERELAEEIRVIADLARSKARSAVHGFLVEGMGRLGYDEAALSASLSREFDMPTPEQAAEETARVFATRYTNDDE